MAWSKTHVKLYSYEDACNDLKYLFQLKKKNPSKFKNAIMFVYRLTKRNSKIKANFQERKSILEKQNNKYIFRNVEFYMEEECIEQKANVQCS